MKVELDIWSSGEMIAFGDFLKAAAVFRAEQEALQTEHNARAARLMGVPNDLDEDAKMRAADVAAETAPPPEPKKTRGKAAAKPTDPAPQSKDAPASSSTAEATDEVPPITAEEVPPITAEEVPPITAEEVRNSIIDLLNDWSEFAKNDAEIRVKTLKPLLAKLDAEKIGGIDPSKYALVPALIDESRAALDELKAKSSEE
jgi:hypothetical protein